MNSFRGLSGGPVVNSKGEKVGIASYEFKNEGQDEGWKLGPNGLRYNPRTTMGLVPLDEIRRTINRLDLSSQ